MRWLGVVLCVLGVVASASTRAQEHPASNDPSEPIIMDPTAKRSDVDIVRQAEGDTPRVKLSLHEAIEEGLRKGLRLETERYGPYIANEDLASAWGAYDPELFANYQYSSISSPQATQLLNQAFVNQNIAAGDAGLRGILPFIGTGYQVNYSIDRTVTNSSLSTLSPNVNSFLGATVTQPLLRNLIWNQPWTRVKILQVGSSAASDEFLRQLMDTVQSIENAYWQLIARSETLRVADKSLETAKVLLDQTQTQYEVGVVSKVEVTEAEAGVATRDFDVITSKNLYLRSQDQLIDLVYGEELRPVLKFVVDPTDNPEDTTRYDVNLDLAVEKAYRFRPELALAKNEVQRREYEMQYAKSQRLPLLDAVGTYGYQGLTGSVNRSCVNFRGPGPCTSAFDDRNVLAANDVWGGRRGLQWTAQGIFSIPIGNNERSHAYDKAQLEYRRANTLIKRTEQDIILDVRNAVRNLESAYEGIESAERSRIAAAEQLRAERIRLEHGESTPFDVLLRERELVNQEQRKIAALQIYRDSATALDRAQGTILQSHNIVVEEVSALR